MYRGERPTSRDASPEDPPQCETANYQMNVATRAAGGSILLFGFGIEHKYAHRDGTTTQGVEEYSLRPDLN